MSMNPPSRKTGLPDVVGVLRAGSGARGGTEDAFTLDDVEK